MGFPDRDVAVAWVGRTVVDREGMEIGACTAVFADDATELVEWVCAEVAGVVAFIPAGDAAGSDGQVQVAVSRADVTSAPAVSGTQHVSEDEEAALYRHYGVPHSRAASPSVLPTGEAEPSTDGVAPDAAAATAEPAVAPTAPAPVTESTVEEDVAPRPWPVSDERDRELGVPAPVRSRRRTALAVGGLAGLALALGTVLRARRARRPQPVNLTQRLAERGRAASIAAGARTGRAAAVAAPQLQSAKQVVLRRGADLASAVAASLTVAARREEQDTPEESGRDE